LEQWKRRRISCVVGRAMRPPAILEKCLSGLLADLRKLAMSFRLIDIDQRRFFRQFWAVSR
jgi:hypothetical protein